MGMMDRLFVPLVVAGYLAAASTVLRVPGLAWRARLFAAVNVVAMFLLWYVHVPGGLVAFAALLAFVMVHHALTRHGAAAPGALPWIAILVPVAVLVLAKTSASLTVPLIGLSYLTFRLAHLVLEVRNGQAPMPSLARHIGFAFFLPTVAVGPISPYALYATSFDDPRVSGTVAARAAMRIVVGAAKLLFLAHLVHRLSYDGLLQDGHAHGAADHVIAGIAYYLYVYCNFSGFCDVMIGAAALLGFRVAENFDSPLAARNVREFWARWHITLSSWMRDVVFGPLSKALLHRLGPRAADHAIAASVFVVFVLVGLWHGFGRYYLLFGALHAAGVTVNHYVTLARKRRLARSRARGRREPSWVRWLAVGITQAYVCFTFYFFWMAGRG